MKAARSLIQLVMENEAPRSALEGEVRTRLNSSGFVVRDKEKRSLEVAKRLVAELIDGDLGPLYDGIGGFDGWFWRAALLGLIDLPPMNDRAFATAALNRERGVVDVFVEQYLTALGAYLRSQCNEEDTRSKDQATEIASQVIEECLAGKLSKYSGKGSLEGWLRRVCRNRLHDWREKVMREQLSETVGDEGDGRPWVSSPENEAALIEAVRHGFTWLKLMFPMELVIIRLTSLHDIPGRTLSRVYGVNESEISRMRKSGMASLRTEISRFLELRGLEYSWEEIILFIAHHGVLAVDEDAEIAG